MSKIIKSDSENAEAYMRFERSSLQTAAQVLEAPDAEEDSDGPSLAQAEALEEARQRLEQEYADAIAAARADVEEKVRDAYDEGLRRGADAGRLEFMKGVESSLQAVQTVAQDMKAAQDEMFRRVEEEMVALARAVVSRVLHREARGDADALRRIIGEVLSHLADCERIVIRVHPEDLALLKEHAGPSLEGVEGAAGATFRADEGIARGGCTVETESSFVDAQLDTQLERILDELTELELETDDESPAVT
jgi:flagellar assembly protein FliH